METIRQYFGSLETEEQRSARLEDLHSRGWEVVDVKSVPPTVNDGRSAAALVTLQRTAQGRTT